ncbi:hypothetical protein EW146_g3910 [Bondarzewia mesenterica]|uniref:Carboxypeptidase n=1 Tax=Bondarzewia mesenterica TaxID=1095465 RepID=A0A4S4LWN9_9AGAM|nr:hypothetical protein EW146_g3910 [Bondarzewia mesenterica]
MFYPLRTSLLAVLTASALVVAYDQRPFSTSNFASGVNRTFTATTPQWQAGYDAELFSPAETLSSLSSSEYTVLSHPMFPSHSIRIKRADFCDATVHDGMGTIDLRSYSGYIDIGAKHIFYYFFESRNDPDTDDVIFWTNGGPGCSSMLGLFMELGPCRVVNDTSTEFHPQAWNSNANVFFVDQPVGVGFSYADHGEYVDTTEEAAKDIAAFVSIFFENFPAFNGRAFHIAGESYGGRYVPLFASQVYDQNAQLVAAGLTPINLTSAIIVPIIKPGNGLTDPFKAVTSYYDMSCTPASIHPVLDISTCVRMKEALPRCEKWLKESCIDQFDSMNCEAASNFCNTELSAPFEATAALAMGLLKKPCATPSLCSQFAHSSHCLETADLFSMHSSITKYLSQPDIRTLLGVSPAASNFTSCSDAVGSAFAQTLDPLRPSYHYVAGLLNRGVRVLIYVGAYDWICNWVGNERWTLALDWYGKEAFVSQELREWEVNGTVAGRTRSANGFTFAIVDGAGHMVPYDKPNEALALINRWLAQEAL